MILLITRSLRQHAVSTCVTVLALALAAGLMMTVFAVNTQTRKAFIIDQSGFDAVLGARGSQLQLVMNAVYHLETSPGNIKWSLYEQVKAMPEVELAIPYAVGDNYHGYRIVGTTTELFEKFEVRDGETLQFQSGQKFDADKKQAVIGSFVSAKTSLTTGSIFRPYHGIVFDESMEHATEFTVTGVLEPTNSPIDHVIWIPIDSFYRMEGHVLRGAGDAVTADSEAEIADEHKEVSAVMLKFQSPMVGMYLQQTINQQGTVATLAFPIAQVMMDLFEKIGWVNRILEMVAYLVVLVAAAGVLASLYNTMNERRREFAILRALGARRRTVFSVILLQSAAISLMGAMAGFAVYAVIMSIAGAVVREKVGVVFNIFDPDWIFLITPAVMMAMGIVAGLLPAIRAYKTDIAENLNPTT